MIPDARSGDTNIFYRRNVVNRKNEYADCVAYVPGHIQSRGLESFLCGEHAMKSTLLLLSFNLRLLWWILRVSFHLMVNAQ